MWITFTLIVVSSSVILPASFDIKTHTCFLDKFWNYKCFKTGALIMTSDDHSMGTLRGYNEDIIDVDIYCPLLPPYPLLPWRLNRPSACL